MTQSKVEILKEFIPVMKRQLKRHGFDCGESMEDVVISYHKNIIPNWSRIKGEGSEDMGIFNVNSPANRGAFNNFEEKRNRKPFGDIVDETITFFTEVYNNAKGREEVEEEKEIVEEAERDTSGESPVNTDKPKKTDSMSSFFSEYKNLIIGAIAFYVILKMMK